MMVAPDRVFAELICKDDQIIRLNRRVQELEARCDMLRKKLAVALDKRRGNPKRPGDVAKIWPIADRIAHQRRVSFTELMGRSQDRVIARARQEIMLKSNEAGVPKRQIAAFFDMDVSTVIYGIRAAMRRNGGAV